MKRILTMQDLSCAGRCSLTEAIPVLSAMELETAVLPTAVLSSHTAFEHVSVTSLLESDRNIIQSWKENGITFDGIYIGYLGSVEAIGVAELVIDTFGNDIPILIDPVFGDHGKLYRGIDSDFPNKLRNLLFNATMICPNVTEACFLTDTSCDEILNTQQYEVLLTRLSTICPGTVIMTGIETGDNEIATMLYTKETGIQKCSVKKEQASFHGTGDLWASVFIGACMHAIPMADAMDLSGRFVKEAIHITLADQGDPLFGTEFEKALPFLVQNLKERKKEK